MNRPRSMALGIAAVVLLGLASASAQAPSDDRKAESPAPAPPKAAPKPLPKRSDEPRMLTAEEMAKRAKGSPFIDGGGTGGGRYGEATPWAEQPPWRRTTFYGVRSVAQTVVFVVDCSGSMADDGRLARAKIELLKSVADLQFPQKFLVIFYDDEPMPMPGALLRSADIGARDALMGWLRTIDADGGTDPRAAMSMAIGTNPDAIYLLSDGAFPDGTVESIAARNKRKIPIHCVDLAGGRAGDHLMRIARDSGGKYAPRP
jgi:hypothetical protein